MKILKFIPGLLLFFAVLGCDQNHESMHADLMFENQEVPPVSEQKSRTEINRKLIKEGYVVFETEDLNQTKNQVVETVRNFKAYLASDQQYKSEIRLSNTLIIRIPAESFDSFLNEATHGIEKFERKEINVRDVTEEFLDVSARLRTKKELELRYLELLKRAEKVSEILDIEEQIGELRAEIESMEGRLNYLEDRVSLSTLTIEFYEVLPEQTAFGKKFTAGFKNGWENLIWVFVFLVNFWPFVLLAFGSVLVIRLFYKRRRRG